MTQPERDLVERLRDKAAWPHGPLRETSAILYEAADEIERLRAMVEGLSDRVAAQSEVLTRRAEAHANPCTGGGYPLDGQGEKQGDSH